MATVEGPNLGVTGARPTSHEDARTMTRQAQDALDSVQRAKRAAATKDPGSVDRDYQEKTRRRS